MKTPADVIAFAREKQCQFVDFKFTDVPGTWHHFTIPITELDEKMFQDGHGFDGSSIRGFQKIEDSDMLLKPDPETAVLDPFCELPTLSLTCDVMNPPVANGITAYQKDPREIARRAEEYLKKTGIADTVYVGPECEFFVFDHARFDQNSREGFYFIDSVEGAWNMREDEYGHNLAYKTPYKRGYFPTSPSDTLQNLRSQMVATMIGAGIEIETHHHEVATAGQCEIDMRFTSLLRMADQVMWYKYITKNVARKAGKTVTFMPKPLFNDNGNGMHVHSSLWKNGEPLFYGDKYVNLSELALWYIGGILKHAPSLLAFGAPTTNSYRRLVPGFEAPVNLVYSKRNRSAAARIPMYSNSPKSKRVEFRSGDPTANPYLYFSALLLAGLDGIENKIDPGKPDERDMFELSAGELASVKTVPRSLDEALKALEDDHVYLTANGVFPEDFIAEWMAYKRENDIDPVRLRPHPYEFVLSFDM